MGIGLLRRYEGESDLEQAAGVPLPDILEASGEPAITDPEKALVAAGATIRGTGGLPVGAPALNATTATWAAFAQTAAGGSRSAAEVANLSRSELIDLVRDTEAEDQRP